MTSKEIRDTDDALRHELTDKVKHMFDLRSQAITEKLEDPSQLRKTRKDIARIKTILRQRELEQHPKKLKQTKESRKATTAANAAAAATK
jgi:large subunit ribosomal protein L29